MKWYSDFIAGFPVVLVAGSWIEFKAVEAEDLESETGISVSKNASKER